MKGRWYEAVGGLGLEIATPDGEYRVAGHIEHRRKNFNIRLNPYQDEGYTLASYRTLEEAKKRLLEYFHVTTVEEEQPALGAPLGGAQ